MDHLRSVVRSLGTGRTRDILRVLTASETQPVMAYWCGDIAPARRAYLTRFVAGYRRNHSDAKEMHRIWVFPSRIAAAAHAQM